MHFPGAAFGSMRRVFASNCQNSSKEMNVTVEDGHRGGAGHSTFLRHRGQTLRSRPANPVALALGRRHGYHNGRAKPRRAFLIRPRGDRDVETPRRRRVR